MRTIPPSDQQQLIDHEWAALSREDQHAILEANLSARLIAGRPDRTYWLKMGDGMTRLRAQALHRSGANHDQHPHYRRVFRTLLQRVPDLEAAYRLDKSAMNKAREMHDNWPAVESFLADLARDNPHRESRLNHPN